MDLLYSICVHLEKQLLSMAILFTLKKHMSKNHTQFSQQLTNENTYNSEHKPPKPRLNQ